ncbi:MAG: GNAT family N-acetyltransferase [Ignavibacteria bacterium]|jgi:peptidyl-dipeptidase Dcp
MNKKIQLKDISIRTELKPGDLGYITYLHASLYHREYNFGICFEPLVAAGLSEFYQNYDPDLDRVWICEHEEKIIGCLFLVRRKKNTAQLRYFLIEPAYRNIGLGKKLMSLFMDFFHKCGYKSSYLWTTHELYAAISLYSKYGFKFTEEKESTAFGKLLKEQRYDLIVTP